MIGRINHIAMVVLTLLRRRNGVICWGRHQCSTGIEDHGVRIAFVRSVNGQVELMEPYGEKSPIAGFLQRNPEGGMHHICYEVNDIGLARQSLEAKGARVLGDGLSTNGRARESGAFFTPQRF